MGLSRHRTKRTQGPVRSITQPCSLPVGSQQDLALVVTGRFHYAIAAATLGVPTVMLDSLSEKKLAVAGDLGLPLPLMHDTVWIGLHF